MGTRHRAENTCARWPGIAVLCCVLAGCGGRTVLSASTPSTPPTSSPPPIPSTPPDAAADGGIGPSCSSAAPGTTVCSRPTPPRWVVDQDCYPAGLECDGTVVAAVPILGPPSSLAFFGADGTMTAGSTLGPLAGWLSVVAPGGNTLVRSEYKQDGAEEVVSLARYDLSGALLGTTSIARSPSLGHSKLAMDAAHGLHAASWTIDTKEVELLPGTCAAGDVTLSQEHDTVFVRFDDALAIHSTWVVDGECEAMTVVSDDLVVGIDDALARFDVQGALRWRRALAAEGSAFTDFVVARADSILVAGHFTEDATLGAGTAAETTLHGSGVDSWPGCGVGACPPLQHPFVAEYSLDGDLAWARRVGAEHQKVQLRGLREAGAALEIIGEALDGGDIAGQTLGASGPVLFQARYDQAGNALSAQLVAPLGCYDAKYVVQAGSGWVMRLEEPGCCGDSCGEELFVTPGGDFAIQPGGSDVPQLLSTGPL